MSVCDPEISEILAAFKQRDRRALAKAITLVESDNEHDLLKAKELLGSIAKPKKPTLRLAISGPPGVGKSTFINVLGQEFLRRKLRMAILPIDPASIRSRGSILGDKTRMHQLVDHPDVIIRPSSSRGILGGVSIAMSDVIKVVESFGFDVVIIETVGVGQSEGHAYSLADFFLLLMQPGAGDMLSAMKRGIVEQVDYLVVNKADGQQKELAENSFATLKAAFGSSIPQIFLVSSLENKNIAMLTDNLIDAFKKRDAAGDVASEREKRFDDYFRFAFGHMVASKMLALPWIADECASIKKKVNEDQQSLLVMLNALGDKIAERCS
jgi:LAO/AO transport system kinase